MPKTLQILLQYIIVIMKENTSLIILDCNNDYNFRSIKIQDFLCTSKKSRCPDNLQCKC